MIIKHQNLTFEEYLIRTFKNDPEEACRFLQAAIEDPHIQDNDYQYMKKVIDMVYKAFHEGA